MFAAGATLEDQASVEQTKRLSECLLETATEHGGVERERRLGRAASPDRA